MLKNIIELSNGTRITSGVGETSIMALSLTQSVNSGTELTLGSTCASMVELTLIVHGKSPILYGDTFTLYKTDGITAVKVGIYTAEEPKRATANTVKITAYDNIIKLDKDITQWLAGLADWPYTLGELAQMVCEQCGISLASSNIPNAEFDVQQFSAQGITGRQMMQWIGEAVGRFCRATADGAAEFAWYAPTSNISIGPTDGENVLFYFQNGMSRSDFIVAPIQKVQIRQNDSDIGTIYPNTDISGLNTYIISGNPLLAALTADSLSSISETLYSQLSQVQYVPCNVTVESNTQISPGDIVTVMDTAGNSFSIYVMERKQSGQSEKYSCTGSAARNSTTAVNNHTLKALSGKVLELSTTVDGMRVENADTKGNVSAIQLELGSISTSVQEQKSRIDGVDMSITELQQKSDGLSVKVQRIDESGAGKVVTETGYTLDENGLRIAKSGSQMQTEITDDGMTVTKSGNTVLTANHKGVDAQNLHATTYLTIGKNSRLEDYEADRTGCFWIGGST